MLQSNPWSDFKEMSDFKFNSACKTSVQKLSVSLTTHVKGPFLQNRIRSTHCPLYSKVKVARKRTHKINFQQTVSMLWSHPLHEKIKTRINSTTLSARFHRIDSQSTLQWRRHSHRNARCSCTWRRCPGRGWSEICNGQGHIPANTKERGHFKLTAQFPVACMPTTLLQLPQPAEQTLGRQYQDCLLILCTVLYNNNKIINYLQCPSS